MRFESFNRNLPDKVLMLPSAPVAPVEWPVFHSYLDHEELLITKYAIGHFDVSESSLI